MSEIKTVIGIPATGFVPSGNPRSKNGKKKPMSIDKDRLQELSDQLTDLVEELDDIKEDLHEMLSDLEDSFDTGDYDGDENASVPMEKMEEICSSVDGAFEELNEALNQMEEFGE